MNNQVWCVAFIAVFILFQLVAIPALILKKNDLADVLWGPGFPLGALAAILFATDGFSSLDLRSWVIFALVTVWALRLFLHVGLRNLSHIKEDERYNNWRRQWGSNGLWRSYLQVFVLQSVILYVLLSPVLLSLASPPMEISFVFGLGVLVWLVGFVFESIGDEQLRRFKKSAHHQGQLMTTGLWSWTRHPNYFGEVMQWWGIWLMVLELPYGWATLISPLGISFLILKVSGVPMLEKLMQQRPGFQEYAARTSIFFPLPPKNFKN